MRRNRPAGGRNQRSAAKKGIRVALDRSRRTATRRAAYPICRTAFDGRHARAMGMGD